MCFIACHSISLSVVFYKKDLFMHYQHEPGDEEILKQVGQHDPLLNGAAGKKFYQSLLFFVITGILLYAASFVLANIISMTWISGLISLANFLLVCAFLIPLCGYNARARLRTLRGIRQRALRLPQSFLASPQPVVRATPPSIARLSMHHWRALYWFLFFICFALLFPGFQIIDRNFSWADLLYNGGQSIFIAFVISLVFLIVDRYFNDQYIEVSEQGIKSRWRGKTVAMDWRDARLFAMYRPSGLDGSNTSNSNNGSYSTTYELANEHTIVRWSQSPRRRLFKIEPTMNEQQFEQWHEQLRGYVVGKIGLPLVELKINKKAE